jgi:hypothetical protein
MGVSRRLPKFAPGESRGRGREIKKLVVGAPFAIFGGSLLNSSDGLACRINRQRLSSGIDTEADLPEGVKRWGLSFFCLCCFSCSVEGVFITAPHIITMEED